MSEQVGGEKRGVVYQPSDPKLVAAVQKLQALDSDKYTLRFIGAQVGALTPHGPYSSAYVSTWMSKGFTNDDWEPAVREWLEQDRQERERRWKKQFFLKNPVTDHVQQWLNFCQTHGKCIAITGDAGIGKTETMDHCFAGKRGVFRIQAGPGMNSANDLAKALMDKIGEDHAAFEMASNRQEGLARFFTAHSFTVAIDDFDLLLPSAYEFLLRYLWNVTRVADKTVPIFLVGNAEGVRHLRKLSPQLASRVAWKPIDCRDQFSRTLVKQFMEHHLDGLDITSGMLKVGMEIANSRELGHLRALYDVCVEVRYALTLDEEDPETVFLDSYEQFAALASQPILTHRTLRSAPRASALNPQPSTLNRQLVAA